MDHPHVSYANGAFNANAEAGPSSFLHSRQNSSSSTIEDAFDPASQKSAKQRDGPKKKKATRACFHCQKAHLTCDDSRPCQRCIKRGIGDSCIEGHRKKAKYLLDDDELEVLKSQKNRRSTADGSQPPISQPQTPGQDPYATSPMSTTDSFFQPSLDAAAYAFGSEGANMEYTMISALLGSNAQGYPQPPSRGVTPSKNGLPSPFPTQHWSRPSDGLQRNDTQPFSASSEPSSTSQDQFHYQPQPQPQPFPFPPPPSQQQQQQPFLRHPGPSISQPFSPVPISQSPQTATSISADGSQFPPQSGQLMNYGIPPLTDDASTRDNMELDFGADAYASVTASYDYTAGYHYLMRYLQGGFDKNDILRVVRALAIFRPSLIALQMPLSAQDEIFVEKCFQRSLVELDKLISMSGTPTVVWRRTGEICLVGLEFSLLTEWPRHELLGGKKFIYELFESQSTVEYWENFANHAFENTTQSVHSHCVLVKPSGQHIPCTFCFSIRRDLFDLPYIVIGQWLPML